MIAINSLNLKVYLLVMMTLTILSCKKDEDVKQGYVVVGGEVLLQGGEFEMGDHFGFVDPSHPTDELPVHPVKLNPFYISTTETTNSQFLEFLNDGIKQHLIEVNDNIVYVTGSNEALYYTSHYAKYYSIAYSGADFYVADFRSLHPVVGVMWQGAVAYCNWLSKKKGLDECYDPGSWDCDFSRNGYRLPTEAEWEFAARGGNTDPYLNYPNGNTIVKDAVNLPGSGDPYESEDFPNTTPVAFYDGKLKSKTEFKWPGSAVTYQTSDGKNGFGLYDMQGNVWEFVNDWYQNDYYASSPYENPRGPSSGSIMPDGKPYRGMRGGNWYNGLVSNGVSDGHSRVSNRNPSYYRGPQDPGHPYYHVGFRVVRNK